MKIAGIKENPVENLDLSISSIPRFCYRKGFEAISGSSLTSDKGWGCCYRSSQGLLAQHILRIHKNSNDIYNQIFPENQNPLSLFADDPKMPFSIHSLVNATNQIGVPIGEWAKPSTISAGIKIILENLGLSCFLAQDFRLNADQISSLTFPCLVLIPGLFGLEKFDKRFLPFLQLCICIDSSLGFVSGQRYSAYYFFGMSSTDIYYFDPHVTKKFVHKTSLNDEDDSSKDNNYDCFYELESKHINALSINPSILLGFSCTTKQELNDLMSILVSCNSSPISIAHDSDLADIENTIIDIDELPI